MGVEVVATHSPYQSNASQCLGFFNVMMMMMVKTMMTIMMISVSVFTTMFELSQNNQDYHCVFKIILIMVISE